MCGRNRKKNWRDREIDKTHTQKRKEWASYKILQVLIVTVTEDCSSWRTSIYLTRIKRQQRSAQEHLELYTNSALTFQKFHFPPQRLETWPQRSRAFYYNGYKWQCGVRQPMNHVSIFFFSGTLQSRSITSMKVLWLRLHFVCITKDIVVQSEVTLSRNPAAPCISVCLGCNNFSSLYLCVIFISK